MSPLPKSDRVVTAFNRDGCSVRMVSFAQHELDALKINEEGGFMVRPSSLVQNDLPMLPLYGGGVGWGIYIDPTNAITSYKSQTFSNNLPSVIATYEQKSPEEQRAEGSLHNYVIKELNKRDGEFRGKIALRNLSIPELKEKLTEMRDRASGHILDIDTKTHLQRLLEQLPVEQPLTQEIMEAKLQEQRIPDYLKNQILKKYEGYFILLENKTAGGMLEHIKAHKTLKSEDWRRFKSEFCHELIGFDVMTGRMNYRLKTGQVSLSRDVYPQLQSDSARELLRATLTQKYPGEIQDEFFYEQLAQAFSSLEEIARGKGPRYMAQSPQYTSTNPEQLRKPMITEIISAPKYQDCLALYFHPDMSEAHWEEAEKFHTVMREQGHDLEYFCLLSDSSEQLKGPFSYEEAHDYRPPSDHQLKP